MYISSSNLIAWISAVTILLRPLKTGDQWLSDPCSYLWLWSNLGRAEWLQQGLKGLTSTSDDQSGVWCAYCTRRASRGMFYYLQSRYLPQSDQSSLVIHRKMRWARGTRKGGPLPPGGGRQTKRSRKGGTLGTLYFHLSAGIDANNPCSLW